MQGLGVLVLFAIEHLAAPEHVVGDDKAAGRDAVEDEVVIVGVIGLIGVDKDEVEGSRAETG